MLLRPSNTLLLDEPTNHLDLDSKEVLLDALVDYGGTLIFVSHDRYFVERLATKIIEVGNGTALVYPGTYKEFLWHKEHGEAQPTPAVADSRANAKSRQTKDSKPVSQKLNASPAETGPQRSPNQPPSRDQKKRADAEARRKSRAVEAKRQQIGTLETQ